MADSFILLSSMSPKLPRRRKRNEKHPMTKLALKKNFRRSSVYDKKVNTSNLIIVSSSTESVSSMDSEKTMSSTSPIVISDSESDSDKPVLAGDFKRSSLYRTDEIKKWIESVNFKYNNIKTSCNLFMADTSNDKKDKVEIKKENLETPNKYSDISFKTFMSGNFENFKSLNEISETEENSKCSVSSPISEVKNKETTQNAFSDNSDLEDQATGVLDEIYGHSWRENKTNVFSYSEPRKKKPPMVIAAPKTEGKNLSNNLLRPLHKTRIEAALKSSFTINLEKPYDLIPDKVSRKKLNFEDICNKENVDILNENLDPGIQNEKQNTIQHLESLMKPVKDQEQPKKTKSLQETLGDLKSKTRRKQHRKKINIACDKTEKKVVGPIHKNSIPYSGSSSSSDDDDTDDKEQWWKPSRKSILKLCKQKETTKVFSFLASLSDKIPPHQSNPSALIYRNNFKKLRDNLVKKLFKLYNASIFENAIPEDTSIIWNTRMRGTAGFCYCRKIIKNGVVTNRSVRIELSAKVVDCAERVRDTLVHELCHAATWMVNNVSNGHGSYWRAWADKAMKVFPELPPIRVCHDYHINTKYTYRCTDCGYSIGRHTKSLDTERKRCGLCYGKFEVLINKKTKEGKIRTVPATTKKPTAFALFVQEHYESTKTPNLNHAEVMTLLGQKYSELKLSEVKD